MTRRDYIQEVSALTAPPALRRRIAALPDALPAGGRTHHRRTNWMGLTAALVVGLGLIAPAIYGALRVGGELDPPPTETIAPVGIIAQGIDVPGEVLDAAIEYVEGRLARAAEHSGALEFVDGQWREKDLGPLPEFDHWRIEGIETCYDAKALGELTVDVYRVDYRLHTTTPERVVLAGGMELDEEGWLLDTYPESTYLVFLLNYSTPHHFVTMINDCAPGSALFDETLLSHMEDSLSGQSGETPPPALRGTAIDQLDYAALEEEMSAEEWAALQAYLPVLREGAAFHWVGEEGVPGGGGEVTLYEYYAQRFGLDVPDGVLDLERLTLFDFEGDGKQELMLCFFNLGGNYLIFHWEDGALYGFERGYRSFMELQTNGVFVASSGAAYQTYSRIQFHAGFYEETLLGQRSGEDYEIGGIRVSGDYFRRWQEDLMGKDLWWYSPGSALS